MRSFIALLPIIAAAHICPPDDPTCDPNHAHPHPPAPTTMSGQVQIQVEERLLPAVLCREGFLYEELDSGDSGICVRHEQYPATLTCPDGKIPADGECFCESPALQSCPDGFTLFGGICVFEEQATQIVSCPEGSILDGVHCVREVPIPLREVCPKGAFKRHGQCLSRQIFAHTFVCPDAWRLVENGPGVPQCIIEEMIDCTSGIPRRLCHDSDACSPTKLQEICAVKTCTHKKMKRKDVNVEVVQQTCLKTTTIDADVYCDGPDECAWDAKQCAVMLPVPPELKCPFRRNDDGSCTRTEKKIPTFACPPDFEFACKGKVKKHHPLRCECQRHSEVSPTPFCSSSAFLSPDGLFCVQRLPPIAHCAERDARLQANGECHRIITEPIKMRSTCRVQCTPEANECISSSPCGIMEPVFPTESCVDISGLKTKCKTVMKGDHVKTRASMTKYKNTKKSKTDLYKKTKSVTKVKKVTKTKGAHCAEDDPVCFVDEPAVPQRNLHHVKDHEHEHPHEEDESVQRRLLKNSAMMKEGKASL